MITPSFGLTATERVLPKLALDFTTATLDPRITFTRSGNTATVVNSSGVIVVVNADLPRFDYSPTTLACKGLLIEEARTNLLTYSSDYSNAIWGAKSGISLAVGVTAPDGTASTLVENTSAGTRFVGQAVTVAASTTYTATVYMKKGTTNFGAMSIVESPNQGFWTFNLDSGVVGNNVVSSKTSTATISDAGGGWYRCSVTATSVGTSITVRVIPVTSVNVSTGAVGDNINVWGAQLEAGAFATSYIPTTSAALTRNADVATMTGTNFSDWYSASQGMFRVDASTPASGTRALISADDNTSGNSIVMSTVGTAPKLVVTQSSAEQANVSAGTITANTAMFVYASYAANYFGIARPSARQVDTSGTAPTVDRLRIGADQSGNYANGIIQAVQFWP